MNALFAQRLRVSPVNFYANAPNQQGSIGHGDVAISSPVIEQRRPFHGYTAVTTTEYQDTMPQTEFSLPSLRKDSPLLSLSIVLLRQSSMDNLQHTITGGTIVD